MKKSNKKKKRVAKVNTKKQRTRSKRVDFFKRQILAFRKIKGAWNKLSGKERVLLFLPAVLAVLLVVIALFVMKSAKTTTFSGQPVQYYVNNAYRLDKDATLYRTKEKKTVMKTSDGSEDVLSSLPIYYEGTTKMLLPENMVYFMPREGEKYRFNYCSEIDIPDNGGNIKLYSDDKEKILSKGFVFDGNDIYIFMEDMIVNLNNTDYEISAGSYVEANFYEVVQIYNRKSGEFILHQTNSDVIATAVNGDYSISLVGDSMTLKDGTKYLLFTEPELLDPIK